MENIRLGNYADILTDRAFRRSFGTEKWKRLTELLLQMLIPEHDIRSISFTPTEHINAFPSSKDIRVDVECTDADGSRFMVEMQLAPQRDFYERAIYNSSFGIQQQVAFGERRYEYKPVYFIGIMDFGFHKGEDRVVYRYRLREDVSWELMSGNLQYIFVELPNCVASAEEAESLQDKVFYSLKNISRMDAIPEGWDDDEIIRLLFESVKLSKFTPTEKDTYLEDMRTKQDIENQIAYAAEQGLRLGMERGIEKGIEKGIERGIEQGAESSRRAIALKMHDRGMDPSDISELTGLSTEVISSL